MIGMISSLSLCIEVLPFNTAVRSFDNALLHLPCGWIECKGKASPNCPSVQTTLTTTLNDLYLSKPRYLIRITAQNFTPVSTPG